LLLRSNLRLLLLQLDRLAETPYFSPRLDRYIEDLREATRAAIAKISTDPPSLNEKLAREILENIWQLTQFLTGSTTKQIPYEVVYAIERAAEEWTSGGLLVTTAIVQDAGFFFQGGRESFFKLVETELGIKIQGRPVQIALPYIYRHKPLFCSPLFHELGHYVDNAREVVGTTMLRFPPEAGPDLPSIDGMAKAPSMNETEKKIWLKVVKAHRQEYFADLFSASYVGRAGQEFLQQFCPEDEVTHTHPASADRFALLDDFLEGRPNPIIDMFQTTLTQLELPPLARRFDTVALEHSLGNVRPFDVSSDRTLFGLFESGWDFLMRQWNAGAGDWEHIAQDDRVDVVNDLIEKSIRNRMIREAWDAAAHT
jgi:hypothetical protein